MCCRKYLCNPLGTFGNKEECPCFNNWKTLKDDPKFP
ncbi:unnamed protein product [Linum tenue]|nr:unnamed protein product [Linum tenue]